MSIGQKIFQLREMRNLTQKELADELNINSSVLNRMERGTRPVRDDELKKISDFFQVSADYLLDRKNTKAKNINLTKEQTKLLQVFDALGTDGKKLLNDLAESVLKVHSKKKDTAVVQKNSGGNNFLNVNGGTNYVTI